MAELNRRDLLRACGLSAAGLSASGWMPALADASGTSSKRQHCILLWMSGGPSQMDTFDLKPQHENGGEYKEIETSVPGLRISEHLPQLAKHAEDLTIIRSLSTAEGDHGRGTHLSHTGYRPGGPISYPSFGSALSKALEHDESEIPNFISISPYSVLSRSAFGPGFLGPRYAALTVGAGNRISRPTVGGYAALGVDDLKSPDVTPVREAARRDLWNSLQTGFLKEYASASSASHNTVYQRAVRMMHSKSSKAFDLTNESAKIRDAYGPSRFGQGCLMARRLIEQGVPCVEVSLRGIGGWDTHADNFARTKALSSELDAGWGTLMTDLRDRGLLESTTIVWIGEFGRTPKVNKYGGRDHYPRAWTSVLAGAGVKGGIAYGRTSANGMTVEDGKVNVGQVFATVCRALGIDPATENISNVGRPIRIVDGKPIEAILA
jgi:hypothetical protein